MAERVRYTRRDLKEPDEFLSAFSRAVAWVRANRTRVLAGAAAVVLLVGGIAGARVYFAWQEERATRDLWPHLNRAREFLAAPARPDDEKLARLEQFLAAHVSLHPDTRAATYARYYLGAIALLRADHAAAAARFREALDSGKPPAVLAFLLREGLARALEAGGDLDGALREYREAERLASGALRAVAAAGEARVLERQGRGREAAEAYRRVLADDPSTPLRDLIEFKLRRAG